MPEKLGLWRKKKIIAVISAVSFLVHSKKNKSKNILTTSHLRTNNLKQIFF